MRILRIVLIVSACLFYFNPLPAMAEPLDKIAKKLSAAAGKIKKNKIAVLPFTNFDGSESEGCVLIAERLTTRLTSGKHYQVVERKHLDKILEELRLGLTGVLEQDSVQSLGRILSVDAVVTGTLVPLLNHKLEVNARLIQTETGAVLAAAGIQMEPDWQETVKEAKIQGYPFPQEVVKPAKVIEQSIPTGPATLITNKDGLMRRGKNTIVVLDEPEKYLKKLKTTPEQIEEIETVWNDYLNRSDYDESVLRLARLRDRFSGVKAEDASFLSRTYLAEALLCEGKTREAIHESIDVMKGSRSKTLKAHALFLIATASEESNRPVVASQLYHEIIQEYPFETRLINAAGVRLVTASSR